MLGASIDSCEPSNCHVKDIVAIDDGTHVLLVEKIQIGGSCIYQILQNSGMWAKYHLPRKLLVLNVVILWVWLPI